MTDRQSLEQRESELNELMQEDRKNSSEEVIELKKKVGALEAEKIDIEVCKLMHNAEKKLS